MADIAEAAYAPYLDRMGGLRPGPMDADHAAAVLEDEAWVAELDGDVVGYVVLVDEADTMLLDNVAVVPSCQGRGVGRVLLLLAEERARATDCSRIRLFTHETMVENQALYQRNGYVETARGGEPGLVRVFYEKRL
ncbi:acetyltransferase [Nocardioides flavus (ex Wang et al. 2016)]|uniref:Acetyltransferase n=2 Tax=Nocardioides flavus (ex Wang et al. 2016) TaxID=2058780 RepID=A0ABQ3HGZ2_9ACTN|nr:acetyltransferase [Nocardioides flavus (ex Wang et al. 2016)]